MSLRATFDRLLAEARASGHSAEAHLAGGAILRVRVDRATDKIMLVISRVDLLVGEKELETFCAHCGVPAGAERRPTEGQEYRESDRRWRVAFIWEKPAELFD